MDELTLSPDLAQSLSGAAVGDDVSVTIKGKVTDNAGGGLAIAVSEAAPAGEPEPDAGDTSEGTESEAPEAMPIQGPVKTLLGKR